MRCQRGCGQTTTFLPSQVGIAAELAQALHVKFGFYRKGRKGRAKSTMYGFRPCR